MAIHNRFDDQFTQSMFVRDPLPTPTSGGTAILDSARQSIVQGWQAIGAAFDDAKRNSDLSPAGQTKRALAEATKQARSVAGEVTSAISRTNIWIRTQETKLPSTTPTDLGKIAAQVELRAVLRSLPSPYAALVASLESGDTRPAAAVLAAPDLCCPLPDGKRDELTALMNRAAAANDPELAQAQALREGIVMLEESYSRFQGLLIGLAKDAQASGAPISDEFAAATGYDRNLMRAPPNHRP